MTTMWVLWQQASTTYARLVKRAEDDRRAARLVGRAQRRMDRRADRFLRGARQQHFGYER